MLIARDNIFLNQTFTDKQSVFRFLAHHAVAQGWADSAQNIEADLWTRENQYSTGFESQIAIPHAKTANVSQAGVIFIRLQQPIAWESLDDQPVQIIFGLLVPEEGAPLLHLQIINSLACQIVEDDFRAFLFSAKDEDELFHFMQSRIEIKEQR
ncbi:MULTISPECIES: PTS sugar transporter subunit IIA [Enterobacteriaceae]|uniref:PTS fructose transporter subunit IIA n=1 Tax=Kluyvera genomosp. 2 TaxID=2774054 RepID=A0A2T2Y6D0_9ENTR|nr:MULTISPECIES: fructose PTS transporter subunit IIA [Enterobacteriaceae]HAT3917390.1 PTS transporter subunit EIIA [Kluyvera ascorbata]PSR48087.1 PTS fructose transporter subunit IIA [Kluyvera genomosp. 2]BBQ84679.1 PTS fructose transporter subunit IIA [Klebsiella sp. WP3-W18-ESBL-02]BBR21729.1 PTS fructose transporter subunit IIA [Klebsiella sp. WP3-S18-ESBL-05]BBR58161.1 PTS fructose transporter subunit IIA [Klebsiella sp. WP4-W18-ESBL-05]